MTESFPVLYILMRTDLASMNAGKGMAQASHASNAFVRHVEDSRIKKTAEIIGLFNKWSNSTLQAFGTVLVLGVNEVQMRTAVDIAHMLEFQAEVINDPTYPILVPPELGMTLAEMDNHGVFEVGEKANYVTIPLDTCGYIFGNKNDPILGAIVGNFPLHP